MTDGYAAHRRLQKAVALADVIARRNRGSDESAADIAKKLDDKGWKLAEKKAGTNPASDETRALVVKILEDREAEHVPPKSVAS